MNITPIEIRQKEFERHFRGYDKDEVNAFLHTLSQAWERMLLENREKSVRLEQAEKDIERVREVEGSLFRTLRTAEDTGAEIVSRAERTAEETKQAAEQHRQEITDEAYAKANALISDAEEKAEAIIRGVREQVEQLKREAEEAENRRQYALTQLQELAQRVMQQVESAPHLPIDNAIEESHRLLEEAEQTVRANAEERASPPADVPEEEVTYRIEEEATSEEENDEEYPVQEEVEAAEEAESTEEVYEPAWTSHEHEPSPPQEPIPAKLKRGSFFDEID